VPRWEAAADAVAAAAETHGNGKRPPRRGIPVAQHKPPLSLIDTLYDLFSDERGSRFFPSQSQEKTIKIK